VRFRGDSGVLAWAPVFGLFREGTALLVTEAGAVEFWGYGGWLRFDFEWARVSPGWQAADLSYSEDRGATSGDSVVNDWKR
jgi:hypothetical protein